MELYAKIQVLRKARNMTQSQLAEKLDVSRQAVQKWESGITSPDIMKIPEIAELFGVTADILLDKGITEEQLLKETLLPHGHYEETPENKDEAKVANHRRSMLDYLLMIPIGLCFGMAVFMFYFIGGILVGMSFFMTLSSLLMPFVGLFEIIVNFNSGAGALLLCLAAIFLGAGLAYPLFWFSRWWLKKFVKLSSRVFVILRKINLRSLL